MADICAAFLDNRRRRQVRHNRNNRMQHCWCLHVASSAACGGNNRCVYVGECSARSRVCSLPGNSRHLSNVRQHLAGLHTTLTQCWAILVESGQTLSHSFHATCPSVIGSWFLVSTCPAIPELSCSQQQGEAKGIRIESVVRRYAESVISAINTIKVDDIPI